jgi:GTP-binding protein HflX
LFFERPDSGERAVLVHIDFPEGDDREDPREFEELVLSAGGDPVAMVTGSRSTPHPRTFIGSGKLEEIADAARLFEAEIVLFNHTLSASQERNLEKALECRVLDRTGLILDIFAQRARTHEGKLQVELAQLQHQSTRLVRGWTHLERQKGGIGLRGPGETQLETDRRLLRGRIQSIHKRLEKVRSQRAQNRRSRKRSRIHSVSLVGYTNAGKSSLFNALTQSDVYAAQQMFATLDPTLRRLAITNIGEIVLADTVGFIRHLPHKLVEAFRATLQETEEADLLLHVIDCADNERQHNIEQVNAVLDEIDATAIPTILIYNKIDLLGVEPKIEYDEKGKPFRVWVSAKDKQGLELIDQAIGECLGQSLINQEIRLTATEGQLRAMLYASQAVLSERCSDEGDWLLHLCLPEADFKQMLSKVGLPLTRFLEENLEDWQRD